MFVSIYCFFFSFLTFYKDETSRNEKWELECIDYFMIGLHRVFRNVLSIMLKNPLRHEFFERAASQSRNSTTAKRGVRRSLWLVTVTLPVWNCLPELPLSLRNYWGASLEPVKLLKGRQVKECVYREVARRKYAGTQPGSAHNKSMHPM